MRISPIFDRVLVEKIAAPDKTPGGIFLPDDAKTPSQLCLVVEVGTGRNIDAPGAYEVKQRMSYGGEEGIVYRIGVQRPSMIVKKGDKVLIGKYSGSDVELGGKTVTIVREDEILAIVHDEAEEMPAPAEEPAA